jgi:hypothetical protein
MDDSNLARADKEIAATYEYINSQRRLLLKLLRERRFKEAVRAHELLKAQKGTLDALRARRRTLSQSSWVVRTTAGRSDPAADLGRDRALAD